MKSCPEPKYLGVTLDRSLMYCQHLRQKLTSWGGLLAAVGVLEQQCYKQPPLPWSTQQQSTALLYGVAVFTPALLTSPNFLHSASCFSAKGN